MKPANTTNDLSKLGELIDEVENARNRQQPAMPKQNPNPKKKNTAENNKNAVSNDLPNKKIQKDILDSIYKNAPGDYSDDVADYMEDKDNALKIINFIDKEIAKKSGEKGFHWRSMLNLTMAVYDTNKQSSEVATAAELLVSNISKALQKKHIDHNKNQKAAFSADPFLSEISLNVYSNHIDFLGKIGKKHVDEILSQLEESEKVKYLRSLSRKNGLEKFNPRNNNKRVNTKQKTGDTTMTEETLPQDKLDELKKYEEIAKVVGINIEGVTPADYDDVIKTLQKAEKDFAVTPPDVKDGNPVDGKDEGKEGENVGITVDGNGGNPTPAPNQNDDDGNWIEQKKAEYRKRAENNEIAGYRWDDTITDGFAAYLEDGGHIHYTDKSNVTVNDKAGLKVFEVLVTESHNIGKPVNFGPNLEHEQAVKLLAACLMHDNPVGKNPPQLSKDDLELLKKELAGRTIKDKDGKDVPAFDALQEALAKYTVNTDENQENNNKPKAFDEETQKRIKEALNNQYEMAALESTGLISKRLPDGTPVKNPEKDAEGNDKYSDEDFKKYSKLNIKQAEDKKLLAEKFIENPEAVRALMKELVSEKTNGKLYGRDDAEKADLAAARQAQIVALKARREALQGVKEGTTQLDEHNDRAARVAKKRDDMSVALGIKEPSDEQKNAGIKKLEGKELSDYIKKNNISKYTYDDLLEKHNDNLKKSGKPEKKKDDAVREACKDSSNIYLAEKGNQGIG